MNPVSVFRKSISRFWWMPFIVGLISMGLGMWTLCSPVASIGFLACMFAASLCATGIVNLIFAGSVSRAYSGWAWPLIIGVMDLICGIWLFSMPPMEMITTFVWVVGIWILVVAFSELFHSFALVRTSVWWIVWMVSLLIATIVIVITFLTNPIEGGVIVWLWLGLSLLLFGLYRVMLGLRIRSMRQ